MVVDDVKGGLRHSTSEDVTNPPTTRTGQHHANSTPTEGSHVETSRVPITAEIALAALANLPTPILVLSSLKTVLLANSAVGRLLGIDEDEVGLRVTDLLQGQTLSQLGVDLISAGTPIWVSWEKFLDNLADGLQDEDTNATKSSWPSVSTRDTAQDTSFETGRGRSPSRNHSENAPSTVVDVVISSHQGRLTRNAHRNKQSKPQRQVVKATCQMIISVWRLEDQRFFTLTFTSSASPPQSKPHSTPPSSNRQESSHSTRSSHSSQSQTPTSSAATSQLATPADQLSGTFFPSVAPPPQCSTSSTLSELQKVLKMKDAMLRAVEIPLIAMWRDESVVFPNQAARKLLAVETDPTSEDSYDFMSRFRPWAADFSRELDEDTNPVIALCRTQQGFTNWQIGLLDEKTGKKFNFDVSGHPVYDEKTGDFLAGLIAFKDVTEYTEQIAHKSAENEAQFRLICDATPVMIWTTRPDGYHDYFSQDWYDFTGLTPAVCMGQGWKLPFHDGDMPETIRRWMHSLATGDPYITEYRCRRHDGQWRWMLGRALPLRDHKTGNIIKWYGTCTDIQDIVDAKFAGQRARQQLLDVLKHSQMTLWMMDRDLTVTFQEGSVFMGDPVQEQIIGRSVFNVVDGCLSPGQLDYFKKAISAILSGTSDFEILENEYKSRWFRSKLVPLKGQTGPNGVTDENYIAGVIVIGSDVTGIRQKEQENITLLANETAAKEASKMKSSFLANMSHEIRTPIAGVLGMAELLIETKLDEEQVDFTQNIQRSANSLLTVINDILDFSKIESGRLDIEEVRFSLGVVLRDVAKMLSFAAQRKGLKFGSNFSLGASGDRILLGDPGRIRQILVNLLTNSIKFTSDGYVKLSSQIIAETSDTVTVKFCVEDSGIGIEEEVKKRLFRPFSQADSSTARRFGGTGLGLTICKNLVELMHGTIRLDSKLDAGTIATFTIPFSKIEYEGSSPATLLEAGSMPDRIQSDLSLSIAGSPTPAPRGIEKSASSLAGAVESKPDSRRASVTPENVVTAPKSPNSPPERSQIHILVVEDNPVNQQIALKFIAALGFSARAVWNGKEALEYLLKATLPNLTLEQAKEYPLPSLILMDVQMPVLDGYHATHVIRHHDPFRNIPQISRIPIVAMTASAIQGDREKCQAAGMDDYMAKPVKRTLLESKILQWIQHGREFRKQRKMSAIGADFEKPPLHRACTSPLSTCSQNDTIATEFYARNKTADPAVRAGEYEKPLSMDREPSVVGQGAARRSSISRAILETSIPGGESAGDLALRRAEAEDKARDLRDAKLLSATDLEPAGVDVHHHNTTSNLTPALPRPNLQSLDSEKAVAPLALTEENISRFNYAQDGTPQLTRTPSPDGEPERLMYTVSEIPGPPPLTATDLVHVSVQNEALASSVLEGVHPDASPNGKLAVPSELPYRPPPSRQDVGGLGPEGRRKSDKSTGTARLAER
ncbi:hypothetical protein H2200_001322 [Cladophialophora chaetospira]|uniref:histidine kinase n=1 Tax=Cladophialophora chaetospira TaxID=386627 RepID=A0AA39CMX9_9EURO|nr:hypothetical protein H2200_001322 [Cladophialophora chaetospira]